MASSYLLRTDPVYVLILLVQRCHSCDILPSQKWGSLGCYLFSQMWKPCSFGRCQWRVWSFRGLGSFCLTLSSPPQITAWTTEENRLGYCVLGGTSVGSLSLANLSYLLTATSLVVTSVVSLAYRIRVFLGNDTVWNGFNLTITTCVEQTRSLCAEMY